uniref:Immediate early response 3-interacting protein 1 n=1 Tax=Trichuris muris TaxID=70415 RepID=A0A5S6PZS7_TRIMR
MISELIISFTLVVNACAVLNFKYNDQLDEFAIGHSSSVGHSIRSFLVSVRQLRVFVAIWNLFIIFLMVVFFGN